MEVTISLEIKCQRREGSFNDRVPGGSIRTAVFPLTHRMPQHLVVSPPPPHRLSPLLSYKELMFEAADVGLVEGAWPRQRVNGQVVGNLFEAWSGRMPDVWIANSGCTQFPRRGLLCLWLVCEVRFSPYLFILFILFILSCLFLS